MNSAPGSVDPIRGPWGIRADDRGVSEVVGYVLVFALVIATIGAVLTVGMIGLEDRQHYERVENVERAFDVLDDNLRDLQRYEDPSRATEMRLGGGTLALDGSTTVTVQGIDEGGEPVGNATTRTIHTIVYSSGDTEIAYEMGAWFRTDGESVRMRSAPRFVGHDDRTVLPIVRTRVAGDRTAVSGDQTVQVGASTGGSPRRTFPEGGTEPDRIRILIESPRADAWERYFEDADGFDPVDSDEGTAAALIEHDDTVYVRVISIDIALRT